MMAVMGLIHPSSFVHSWKVAWYDGAISVVSFLATLAFRPHLDKGIMIGVVLSLAVFLYRNMRPTVSSLARTEEGELRDATRHGLDLCPHVDMVRAATSSSPMPVSWTRPSPPVCIPRSEAQAHRARGQRHQRHGRLRREALSLVIDRCRSRGVDISMSGVNDTVMAILDRSGLLDKLGRDHLYANMEQALCSVHADTAHRESTEARCPLTTACRLTTQPQVGGPASRAFATAGMPRLPGHA